jgi:phosphomannomutase / phosphoglucomutase
MEKSSIESKAGIFKAYDIRGIVDKTLTEEIVLHIGRAFGIKTRALNLDTVVIGRDGRLSGPNFIKALSQGLRDQGINVIDVGMVATPMVYFATHHFKNGSGIMITGSHNPPEYNGLKMVLGGAAIYGAQIQELYQLILDGKTADDQLPTQPNATGAALTVGQETRQLVWDAYRNRITSDARLARRMKVVVDCGNGAPGAYAGELLRALGCDVVELFCEVDGNFPNHHPDPAHVENLQDLIKAVKDTDAELGLAFDGDGDRLGVVTKQGDIIWPDRQLMLYARDILAKQSGQMIIFDVKCSRLVAKVVREAGGVPLMWKTGHSLVKAKLKETGAAMGGEMSGHTFFNDRWYGFDDGLYTAARLLEILSRSADPSAVLNDLPNSSATPELNIRCEEGENVKLVEALKNKAQFSGMTEIIDIDGLRVEYPDGFGLVRSSNTTPVLVLRFEADNAAALERIQAQFRDALKAVKPSIDLSF